MNAVEHAGITRDPISNGRVVQEHVSRKQKAGEETLTRLQARRTVRVFLQRVTTMIVALVLQSAHLALRIVDDMSCVLVHVRFKIIQMARAVETRIDVAPARMVQKFVLALEVHVRGLAGGIFGDLMLLRAGLGVLALEIADGVRAAVVREVEAVSVPATLFLQPLHLELGLVDVDLRALVELEQPIEGLGAVGALVHVLHADLVGGGLGQVLELLDVAFGETVPGTCSERQRAGQEGKKQEGFHVG